MQQWICISRHSPSDCGVSQCEPLAKYTIRGIIGTVSSTPSITVFSVTCLFSKLWKKGPCRHRQWEDGVTLVQELSRHKKLARLHWALFTVLGDGAYETERWPEIRASQCLEWGPRACLPKETENSNRVTDLQLSEYAQSRSSSYH